MGRLGSSKWGGSKKLWPNVRRRGSLSSFWLIFQSIHPQQTTYASSGTIRFTVSSAVLWSFTDKILGSTGFNKRLRSGGCRPSRPWPWGKCNHDLLAFQHFPIQGGYFCDDGVHHLTLRSPLLCQAEGLAFMTVSVEAGKLSLHWHGHAQGSVLPEMVEIKLSS